MLNKKKITSILLSSALVLTPLFNGIPTHASEANRHNMKRILQLEEKDSIRRLNEDRMSKINLDSLSITSDKHTVEKGEFVNLTLHIDDAESEFKSFDVKLRVVRDDTPYFYNVYFSKNTEGIFEGGFTVSDMKHPGVYYIDQIKIFEEYEYNPDVIQELGTIYNSDFYSEKDYSKSFSSGVFEVKGTKGMNAPLLEVTSPKNTYTKGEKVKIEVLAKSDTAIFGWANIGLQYSGEQYFSKYIELESVGENKFIGEFTVGEYDLSGEYLIGSLELFTTDDYIFIQNIKNAESGYGDFFSDFSGFSIEIKDTLTDLQAPKVQSFDISKTVLNYGDSFIVNAVIEDAGSGVQYATFNLSSEDSYIDIPFRHISGNNYQATGYFDLEHNISEKYFASISVGDNVNNYDHILLTEPGSKKEVTITFKGDSKLWTISGSNRFNTANEISRQLDNYGIAILASGENFPDALAAGPLAAGLDMPIFLAQKDKISPSTLNTMVSQNITGVFILGGDSAISDKVVEQLETAGITIFDRIAGKDRYNTAVRIALELGYYNMTTVSKVVLANGMNYPDALSIGSYASSQGIPILLTKSNVLHPLVKQYLVDHDIKEVDIVGGENVIGKEVVGELTKMGIKVQRLSGNDRFGTSAAVAEKLFPNATQAVVANGMNFADALAAVPMAAKFNMPILLVRQDRLSSSVSTYINNQKTKLERIVTVGGDSAVGTSVKDTILNMLK